MSFIVFLHTSPGLFVGFVDLQMYTCAAIVTLACVPYDVTNVDMKHFSDMITHQRAKSIEVYPLQNSQQFSAHY
jgi:hypothetical protein